MLLRNGFLILVGLILGCSYSAFAQTPDDSQRKKAVFAGGCFWCMEEAFEQVDGVESVVSGYIGGDVADPSYRQVSTGETGHYEAVEVTFDPAQVSYDALLDVFWHNIDPLDDGGQFCDRGSQYRAAIFYRGTEQEKRARASKQQLADSGRFEQPIVTEILPAGPFYAAEDYHQEYYKKNPLKYKFYKGGCGRQRQLNRRWE